MSLLKQPNLRVAFALLAGLLSAVPAMAATTESEAQRRYQAAFNAVVADAANPERSFELVQAAVAAGEFRAAIAALERILLINPTLSNIKLELGVLYLRAGSPDLAVSYIDQALNDPNMPPLVRTRAEELLNRAKAGAKRQSFFATLGLAIRTESNANAGPDSPFVRVGGTIGQLADQFTGRSDTSLNLSAALQHRYAFGSQFGHQLETDLYLFGSRYQDIKDVETTLAELRIGPRFYVGPVGNPNSSLRPYLLSSHLQLAGEKYNSGFGAGLDAERYFTGAFRGDVALEYRDQDYHDSVRSPTATNRIGKFTGGSVGLAYQPTSRTTLGARLLHEQASAKAEFEAYKTTGATVFVAQEFNAPFGVTPLPWNVVVSATARNTSFDAPDPAIDPNIKRDDDRMDYGISLRARVTRTSDVVFAVQLSDRDSNLPNFVYDNSGVSLGGEWRF